MKPSVIKVCGMREEQNIKAVEQIDNVNWMGFILWPGSKRYVASKPGYLPARCKKVGVMVNATLDEVKRNIKEFQLDIVQLHGHESPDFCQQMKEKLTDIKLIKAFSITPGFDFSSLEPYDKSVDYFLFDTPCSTMGGSGKCFDWGILSQYHAATPFLLSGGIGPHSVTSVLDFQHPMCVGIDLNSMFETRPALKDSIALQQFIENIK